MGLSSLPGPSEGMLCIILVNAALSISMFKGIVRSVLHLVGIRLSPSSVASSEIPTSETFDFRICQPESFLEEFRNRTPTLKFESLCKKQEDNECSVCLTKFEEGSEVNKLKCGHLFHKTCVEKWIDYWNITCPLCRTPLVAEDQQVSSYVW
ncbi:probable E3 ubiquitin-protein ligase XERICO [Brassica rapa]|uniref:RING-type domain-containing protein n=1 Tax=Brassica campestris TaxID=3711 RepID=M4D9Q1_BRACM|nr:probable E3 ubiquitin-protein ligase XERICO [Brassica rapa]XP_033144241.1 probable E3 ubiquitin-protein ligase XERICO [Brassica rapa]XP_033144242.1 probable E3 ubiquitin-protein ligase XERICO [Brassica rapa]